jgi:ADP-heptose:LPS heptosyltransferase
VLLEVHAPLKELLGEVEGVDAAFALGEALPAFDLHCALMSLPLAFDTRLDSIPADIPYLSAPEAHVERWRERLEPIGRPRVGLAWSGSRTLRNDANRSIPLAMLAPLAQPGRSLLAVQKDIREADRAAVAGLGIATFEQELHDFRDTAALVAACDVIVSVDTSVAHLAGAMGKTVFVLLPFSPDWRWLLDREESPWYPSARLFRQERSGDWDAVIARLASRLRGDESVALPPVK